MAGILDENVERKKKGAINRRKPFLNPTVLQVTVNLYDRIHIVFVILYTKYKLYSHGDSFGEKCREKEWINTWKNIPEKAGSQLHNATSHCQFIYEILTFYIEQLLKNLSSYHRKKKYSTECEKTQIRTN